MALCVDVLRAELSELCLEIAQIEKAVDELPRGSFRSYERKNGTSEWYSSRNGKKIYIKKNEENLAKGLVRRKYLSLKLKELKNARENLEKALDSIEKNSGMAERFAKSGPDIKRFLQEELEPWSDEIRRWQASPYKSNHFHPEGLIYKTQRGEFVRSKSEVIIADTLYGMNYPYRYECALNASGTEYYP